MCPIQCHSLLVFLDIQLNTFSKRLHPQEKLLLVLLLGAELPLVVESFGLLNNIFPFPSILDAGYPVFILHLAITLFDVILPSVLGSSL